MNRRKLTITISIIVVLLLLGGAYWYLSKNKIIPSFPTGTFPGESGISTGVTTVTTGGEGAPEQFPTGTPLPRLYELHKSPVAGAGFSESDTFTGHSIATRYIEKGLGYIFETPLSTYKESRIVNDTRPSLSEALWGNNGNSVVVRFIDPSNDGVIKTHIVNIGSSSMFPQSTGDASTPSDFLKTEEIFLPDFIPFMSTAEDRTNQLFYLQTGDSASVGSISTFTGSNVSKIFNASFTEWLPQFPNQNLVTLTTRPSATIPGYLYFIDLRTKILTKILSGINGLTTLTSHDGNFVLTSETKLGGPELSVYDINKKQSFDLSLQTLPEKCAWGYNNPTIAYCGVPHTLTAGTYPDQWYQGVISFSDDLWEIDTTTLATKKIMSPSDFKASSLDIINPVLSSDDGYLLFMNKTTGTPWVYQISEGQKFASTPDVSAPVVNSATTTATTTPQPVVTSGMQKLK